MARVFIGIGSNEGDRLERISKAIQALGALTGVTVVQIAMIRETEPVGGPPQGPYLNTVVEAETEAEPLKLLRLFQDLERRLGRVPSAERWGPRPIDLDLLLYDDRVIDEPGLCIPHPRMHERSFVLEPLAELAPDLVHPLLKKTAASLRDQCISTAVRS